MLELHLPIYEFALEMDEAENQSTVKTNVGTSPPQSEGRSPSQTSEPAILLDIL